MKSITKIAAVSQVMEFSLFLAFFLGVALWGYGVIPFLILMIGLLLLFKLDKLDNVGRILRIISVVVLALEHFILVFHALQEGESLSEVIIFLIIQLVIFACLDFLMILSFLDSSKISIKKKFFITTAVSVIVITSIYFNYGYFIPFRVIFGS